MRIIIFVGAFCALATVSCHILANQQYAPLSWLDTSPTVSDKQLEQLFLQYKKRKALFDQFKDDDQKLFDLIVDEELVKEGFNLRLRVNHAIDTHQVLPKFREVGFVPSTHQSSDYEVDYRQNSHLLKPSDLFRFLTYQSGVMAENSLLQRGFTPSNIKHLKTFIDQSQPIAHMHHFSLNRIRKMIPKLKSIVGTAGSFNKENLANVMEQLNVEGQYYDESHWLNWGRKLLQQFDLSRQRILKSYLLERQTQFAVISPSVRRDHTEDLTQMAIQLRNGEFELRIKERLVKLKLGAQDE